MKDKRRKEMQKYWNSDEWAEMKVDLITVRGQRCQRCGKWKPIQCLAVHHLSYKNFKNEKPEDVVLICHECHQKEHGLIKEKAPRPKRMKKGRNNDLMPGKRLRSETVYYKKVCTVCGEYMKPSQKEWSCSCGRVVERVLKVAKVGKRYANIRLI